MSTSCILLPLSRQVLYEAVIQAKDWALSHGITLRTKESPDKSELISYAPFTLLPTPIPQSQYEHVVDIQRHINLLIHQVANDEQFISKVLKSTIEVDEFTAKLYDIYKSVQKEGAAQPLQLGLLRSDYMIDVSHAEHSIKQVEINTIASSFAGLGQQVASFHRYILEYLGHPLSSLKGKLPKNHALEGLAFGIYSAHRAYDNISSVILFLVEPITRNIFDQRWLEYSIRELDPSVQIIRRSLAEMRDGATLTINNSLIIDGNEISVVYMRDGYIPQSYQSEQDWSCRLMIERSRAIKCPSIHYHLAGTKKVQQELSRPGVVETYIQDQDMCDKIRRTFANQYSLDMGSEGDDAANMGITNPDQYVLKPQLEGGGNNLFGDHIRQKLLQLSGDRERASYILMEKIISPQHKNYIIKYDGHQDTPPDDALLYHTTVSELGIYGVILADSVSGQILCNQCGHLVRTKEVSSTETGVAAGFGSLDSPYLY